MALAPDLDYAPGDPAKIVLGKNEEQPARVHAPQPPKPPPTLRTIHADVKLRLAELQGVPEEFARLEGAWVKLVEIPTPDAPHGLHLDGTPRKRARRSP